MFKKLLIASAIIAVTSSAAFANAAPYIGGSIGVLANTSKNGFNYRGMPGDLFAGFGTIVGQNIYMGGEVFATLGTATLDDNGLKSTYGYGISFIPGIMLSEHTMGYLRVGVVRNHFAPKLSGASTVSGGQVGFGLQTSLMQNWDLRSEYVYTASKSVNSTVGSPRTDRFNLGLIYKFD